MGPFVSFRSSRQAKLTTKIRHRSSISYCDASMTIRRLPHLQHERTRHGQMVWYVRVKRGPRIRIQAKYGSPEFLTAYHHAVKGRSVPVTAKAGHGSLKWLFENYMASPEWASTARHIPPSSGSNGRQRDQPGCPPKTHSP